MAGILNIGTAHLGEFGGRDGICRAKSKSTHILPENRHRLSPQDDFSDTIRQMQAINPEFWRGR